MYMYIFVQIVTVCIVAEKNMHVGGNGPVVVLTTYWVEVF